MSGVRPGFILHIIGGNLKLALHVSCAEVDLRSRFPPYAYWFEVITFHVL